MDQLEQIIRLKQDRRRWYFWWCTCDCGNIASEEGFQPCNRYGEWVDLHLEEWTEPLYLCLRCGAIILQPPPTIVGVRHDNIPSRAPEWGKPSKEAERSDFF